MSRSPFKKRVRSTSTSGEPKILDPSSVSDINDAVEMIQYKIEGKSPEIAIVCGSGWSSLPLPDQVHAEVDFAELFLPKSAVPSHNNKFVFGDYEYTTEDGTKQRAFICVLKGRLHPYEFNMNTALCSLPILIMARLGIKKLILTNAVGGSGEGGYDSKTFVLIDDHICLPALSGFSPLMGIPTLKALGLQAAKEDKFVVFHNDTPYRKNVNEALMNHWQDDEKMKVKRGVYAMQGGPEFETPAEINFLLTHGGANCVGLSLAHEALVAKYLNMDIVGISLITNTKNDPEEPNHDAVKSTMEEGSECFENGAKLLNKAVGLMLELPAGNA
ncbi:hypothetical protein QR680_017820 [Steinernema hermaphroditum]|uniref:purine-nucleoside phosphorylase n=1 Tax=Steinernema hermaphroditum TaxID=289476 RepID=A0AA39HFY4_9BILA|nr:hypothetical protein QR680_017820 [Steinernema hermaphroditum]